MEETDKKPEVNSGEEEASTSEVAAQIDEQPTPSVPEGAVPANGSPKERTFPGEIPGSFQESLQRIPQKERRGGSVLTLVMQPILGALPNQVKRDLEATVGNRMIFSAATATGLNIMLNFLGYPVLMMLVAIGLNGVDVIFSQKLNGFILLGLFLGFLEGFYRIREGLLRARPVEEMILRGSIYGGPLSPLAPLFAGGPRLLRDIPVPVKGFYEKGYVDKVERERRYGHAYTIEDLGAAYHLRLEFPRRVPDLALLSNSDLPSEMPDYEYDLSLKDGHFIVKGKLTDERVRRYCGGVGAFPGEFTTVIPLDEAVGGFSHRFENKLLDVLLVKGKADGKSMGA